MRNVLIFIVLLSSWSCSGRYQEQKDHQRPAENSQKEHTAYIFDSTEEVENNKPGVCITKDSFFVTDSVYKFLSQKKRELERSFSTKAECRMYPLYYGGSYVNRGDDRLSIYVVDSLNNRDTRHDIVKRIGTERFNIRSCAYSFEMLSDTLRALETLFNRKKETLPPALRMSRFEIYEPGNAIVVLLQDSTSEVVSAFKKYLMDSPMIQFAGQPVLYLQ